MTLFRHSDAHIFRLAFRLCCLSIYFFLFHLDIHRRLEIIERNQLREMQWERNGFFVVVCCFLPYCCVFLPRPKIRRNEWRGHEVRSSAPCAFRRQFLFVSLLFVRFLSSFTLSHQTVSSFDLGGHDTVKRHFVNFGYQFEQSHFYDWHMWLCVRVNGTLFTSSFVMQTVCDQMTAVKMKDEEEQSKPNEKDILKKNILALALVRLQMNETKTSFSTN